MTKHQLDGDIPQMFRSWLFDLHRMGRRVPRQTQAEVEQIAVLVVGAGGSIQEAFSAARGILAQPAS